MLIFPAIDIYAGKAVRLYKGDYREMTVYSENPPEIGKAFAYAALLYAFLEEYHILKSGAYRGAVFMYRLYRAEL